VRGVWVGTKGIACTDRIEANGADGGECEPLAEAGSGHWRCPL